MRVVLASAVLLAISCSIPPRGGTWTEPEPGLFTTGPYILVTGEGEALVAMKSEQREPPEVSWWVVGDGSGRIASLGDIDTAGPDVVRVAAERNADLWVAKLEGLPVGAQIAYRVRGATGETDPQVFRVGVEQGKPFRFAVFGDTRTNHFIHRKVIESMAREEIEFVVHTGDMVDRGGVQWQWDLFFQIERPLLEKVPIVPSIGNHDMGARRYFRHYFQHQRWTRGRRYFSHDWGNLRIVVIDGGIECRDGCEQYVFAEKALAEGAERGMLMAMMLHYPPYSSGAHGSHDGVQESISELAKKYGVELVIAGHDHNYERTVKIDGVTYVVSGSAGAPIRPIDPQWFTAEARTEPHYVLVDVESRHLVLRAVNLRGDTFDTAILNDNPPAPR